MRSGRHGHGPGCGPEWEPGPARGGRCNLHHHVHGHRHSHSSGGRPRMRCFERGGVKFAILGLLKEKPRHGYDIIREMEERSGGFYSPSPGVVYPTLQALEDRDLVTSITEEGKKVYQLTDAGLAFLGEHKERARRHHERWEKQWGSGPGGERSEAVYDIRDALSDVRRAVRRSTEDPEKLKEISTVLGEAVTKIREIAKR
jgi:DNA-binding PadR family transcriptional regulator